MVGYKSTAKSKT